MKITARYPWATRELWIWLERIEKKAPGLLIVTSLYRPRWYNTLAGGVWNSYHLKGRAADIAHNRLYPEELAKIAVEESTPGSDVVIERKKMIVHIEIED